jgi:hypothetical protein
MNKLLLAMAALPFTAGVAAAAGHPQPLTDREMDSVNAGYAAISIADAEGYAGALSVVVTTTATVSQVLPIASFSFGESSSTLFKSVAASQSSTVTSTYRPVNIPGVSPGNGP